VSIKCGNCGNGHENAAGVRACYNNQDQPRSEPPATDKQASLAQALVRERQPLDKYAEMDRPEYEQIVAEMGKYSISKFIDEMLRQSYIDGKANGIEGFDDVLPGRYALDGEDGTLRFYWLKDEDEHGNPRRLVQLVGAPGDFVQRRIWRPQSIMEQIARDSASAMIRFGLEVGKCGKCGSPLTDEASRARGIGPICAEKL
jgi:hypothetical protein